MKKLYIIFLFFIFTSLVFIGCASRSTPAIIDNVETSYASSNTFTDEEIEKAFQCVKGYFGTSGTFDGCELLELYYDDSKNNGDESPNKIIINSKFYISNSAADGFNHNSYESHWRWILKRKDKDSPWGVFDYGHF